MATCLLTKLGGIVDDDTLLKLGEMRCRITTSGTNHYIQIVACDIPYGEQPMILRIPGNGYFKNSSGDNLGKTFEIPARSSSGGITTKSVYFSDDVTEVIIGSKYDLRNWWGFTGVTAQVDLDDLQFSSKLLQLMVTNPLGTLDKIPSSVTALSFASCSELGGDLSVLQNNLSSLAMRSPTTPNTKITGSIGDINTSVMQNISLENLKGITGDVQDITISNVLYDLELPNCTGITGSVEALLEKIKNNASWNPSVLQKTIILNFNGTQVTYQGSRFTTGRFQLVNGEWQKIA